MRDFFTIATQRNCTKSLKKQLAELEDLLNHIPFTCNDVVHLSDPAICPELQNFREHLKTVDTAELRMHIRSLETVLALEMDSLKKEMQVALKERNIKI